MPGPLRWFFSKEKKEDGLTLSDVLRGIHYSVNSSVEIAENHYSASLGKYFDDLGKPLTQRIYIKDDYYVDLPLICLSNHSSLVVDEMIVKMNVVIKNADLKKATAEADFFNNVNNSNNDSNSKNSTARNDGGSFNVSRASFEVELGNPVSEKRDSALVDITIKFKFDKPPESVSRILDQLNNTVKAHCNKSE